MNWISKLVKGKYDEKTQTIGKKESRIKWIEVSFWLDVIKMAILGISAIGIIGYSTYLCIKEGEVSLPSFLVAIMSIWILFFSIARSLIKKKLRLYVDVIFLFSMIVVIIIACVCMSNGWYSDLISLIASTSCFAITVIIETYNSFNLFKQYYSEKKGLVQKEIEAIEKKSPLN